MAGDPTAQVPFNFFAGTVEATETPLAFESGYLYVITSIVVSTGAGSPAYNMRIVDAEANIRFLGDLGLVSGLQVTLINLQCEMVLGGASGAYITASNAYGFASVDGYAVAPLGSTIW